MTVAEAKGSGLREKFRQLQTECWTVHAEVPAGSVDVMRIVKRSVTLEEQLRESDRML